MAFDVQVRRRLWPHAQGRQLSERSSPQQFEIVATTWPILIIVYRRRPPLGVLDGRLRPRAVVEGGLEPGKLSFSLTSTPSRKACLLICGSSRRLSGRLPGRRMRFATFRLLSCFQTTSMSLQTSKETSCKSKVKPAGTWRHLPLRTSADCFPDATIWRRCSSRGSVHQESRHLRIPARPEKRDRECASELIDPATRLDNMKLDFEVRPGIHLPTSSWNLCRKIGA